MNNLHIINYDHHMDETLLDKPLNGLERFCLEFSQKFSEDTQYFLHVNDSYFLNKHLQMTIIWRGEIVRTFYQYLKWDDADSVTHFFTTIINDCQIDNLLLHYNTNDIVQAANSLMQLDVNRIIVLHDVSLFSMTLGVSDDYSKRDDVEKFLKSAHAISVPSQFMYNKVSELYPEYISKIYLIENDLTMPIQKELKLMKKHEKMRALFLGNITIPEKGSEIMKRVVDEVQEVDFYLLGRANNTQNMDRFIYANVYNKNDLQSQIEMISPDIVIIPSLCDESFNYTALEATYLGYPVLCFPSGGLNRIKELKLGYVSDEKTYDAFLKTLNTAIVDYHDEKKWGHIRNDVIEYNKMKSTNSIFEGYSGILRNNNAHESVLQDGYLEKSRRQNQLMLSRARGTMAQRIEMEAITTEQGNVIDNLRLEVNNYSLERESYKKEYKELIRELRQKQNYINELEGTRQELSRKEQQLAGVYSELEILKEGQGVKRVVKRAVNAVRHRGGVFNTAKGAVKALKRDGVKGTYYRFTDRDMYNFLSYKRWLEMYEQSYTKEQAEAKIKSFAFLPTISIVMPVYNVGEKYLRACIDSVIQQQYPHWELCIADDNSSEQHVRVVLDDYMRKDKRIKVVYREENGHISAATNSALELATGEYIALLDNDDCIRNNALLEVVHLINEQPNADMIYSDEDKLDESGRIRSNPFFKPDWSPDTFMGHMYTCHFGVYRRSIALAIGGFRTAYDGAQDYDFVLRFTEQTKHIYHIPKILYHWRMLETSTASGGDSKDYAFNASVRAKEDALQRRGIKGTIEQNEVYKTTNVVYHPDESDFISIIIPTRNHGLDVKKCVDSIYEMSTWENFEIILVDNGSDDETSIQIFKDYEQKYSNFKRFLLPIPFNYSKLNNEAVKIAKGNLLLFLNNDTEVLIPDWLERMAGQAKLSYAGAVGARLFYANNHIQHSGVIALSAGPSHAFHNFRKGELGYYSRLLLSHNYLAVTGAVLMVERSKFEAVGGFNEIDLPIAYNDVDLCIKLYDKGYFNVVRNDVDLYHYESLSRGYDDEDEAKKQRLANEREHLMSVWKQKYLTQDPFYNPNLADNRTDFIMK